MRCGTFRPVSAARVAISERELSRARSVRACATDGGIIRVELCSQCVLRKKTSRTSTV